MGNVGLTTWQLRMIGIIVAVQRTASLCDEKSDADGTVYLCNSFAGTSWSLLPDTGGPSSLVMINSVLGDSGYGTNTGFFLAFILILAFQSVLTMGLHCAELLVNLSRDEDIWRETYTAQVYKTRNGLLIMLRSWKILAPSPTETHRPLAFRLGHDVLLWLWSVYTPGASAISIEF